MQTLYNVKAHLPLDEARYIRLNYTFDSMDERKKFVAGLAKIGGVIKKVTVEDVKSADQALAHIEAYLTNRGL